MAQPSKTLHCDTSTATCKITQPHDALVLMSPCTRPNVGQASWQGFARKQENASGPNAMPAADKMFMDGCCSMSMLAVRIPRSTRPNLASAGQQNVPELNGPGLHRFGAREQIYAVIARRARHFRVPAPRGKPSVHACRLKLTETRSLGGMPKRQSKELQLQPWTSQGCATLARQGT